jgi:hypothetical protein
MAASPEILRPILRLIQVNTGYRGAKRRADAAAVSDSVPLRQERKTTRTDKPNRDYPVSVHRGGSVPHRLLSLQEVAGEKARLAADRCYKRARAPE